MDPALPRTREVALGVRDQLAATGTGSSRRMALVSRTAAMTESDGQPAMIFRNEPWANGAVWSLNPNPRLPRTHQRRDGALEIPRIGRRLMGRAPHPRLDGEYLDSLGRFSCTADLNFRRDHFRWTTVPLSFATDTRRPALFKGLAVHEFTRWIGDEVHGAGGLMSPNSVSPVRVPVPLAGRAGHRDRLDAGGNLPAARPGPAGPLADPFRSETLPPPHEHGLRAVHPGVRRALLQRSLFLGFFPSMFSHNASENPYWGNRRWYDRDRELFRKYVPRVKSVAEAGWEPVTGARCDNSRLWIERFGPGPDGVTWLTVHNDSAVMQSAGCRWCPRRSPERGPRVPSRRCSPERGWTPRGADGGSRWGHGRRSYCG